MILLCHLTLAWVEHCLDRKVTLGDNQCSYAHYTALEISV